MKISLAWVNSMLEPGDVSAAEAERLLTFVGFPIESAEEVEAGGVKDVRLDVEVTSNRGDCLSHAGVAREIAAASGRRLRVPEPVLPSSAGAGIGGAVTLENRVAGPMGVGGCPLFTLRLIRGVKVGPSPAWLARRLEAVGQRPINNVVDATNYVLFELGSPSHVFDLAKMRGGSVVVRGAEKGERLALLDGKTVELHAGELVVADGSGASSLAGIMGGAESAVSGATTDVLLEVATWSPGPVRACARRLNLRTDASHRFERRVDARTVEAASQRVAQLIIETAGGTLAEGVLSAGAALPAAAEIGFRPARCRVVLGAAFDDARMGTALAAQGVDVSPRGATVRGQPAWRCVAPGWRPDLLREEDLIEEVARTIGLDQIPVQEKVAVRATGPQGSELAAREMSRVLTGLGFYETVTFSFVRAKEARPFTPPGVATLSVSDDRRGDEGTLRPSVVQSLIACRRANQHAKSAAAGSVRLFEIASVYGETSPGQHIETRNLGLLMDLPTGEGGGGGGGGGAFERRQRGLRLVRGVIEEIVTALRGPGAASRLVFEPGGAGGLPWTALDASASARVSLDGAPLGVMGLLSPAALSAAELEHPVGVAELGLAALVEGYPPRALVAALPAFPAVERDLSLVVNEAVTWGRVEGAIGSGSPRWMESLGFVYSYRGKPLEAGKKSLTLRMTFREGTRTLRDEEVNAEVQGLIERLGREVGAVVRV
ncbi:MAG: phenylalanine--tRNA ligase subunit beta [Phycisphaerae bacterium]|nr:phenylalanine--tRNA ligase subunit beta [Phycisphaerae bacterium]